MQMDNIMDGRPTLLAVLAHPDDETFGMGGTLALYASQGVDVHLVCATRGEVGTVDADCLEGYSSIAELREAELRCAAGNLGLSGVHFLDYRDSGMPGTADNAHPRALAAASQEEVVEKVVDYIRRLRPQVVITFDPIGGYRHPDHIAIQRATTIAFSAAADAHFCPGGSPAYQSQRLYYQTMSKTFLRMVVRILPIFGQDPHRFGRNKDVDLVSLAREVFPINAVIDYKPVAEQRTQAARCHASQGGGAMTSGIQGWVMRFNRTRESFMQAYPPPQDGKVVQDLFAGVDVIH
jgi:LmbE family N-acetylglucosaminyl deacetylase